MYRQYVSLDKCLQQRETLSETANCGFPGITGSSDASSSKHVPNAVSIHSPHCTLTLTEEIMCVFGYLMIIEI